MEHLTSTVLCAPSPGIIVANLQGKDCPLECPHNGQKQPIRPTHEAEEQEGHRCERASSRFLTIVSWLGSFSSYQSLSCLRAGVKLCLYISQCKVSIQEMSAE